MLRVDDEPVVLLYGALPAYRDLAESAKGADVRQLEQNLSALGYREFTVDQEFSATTTAAVKRWQKDLGVLETGTVERARVIYTPGAVRVARHMVRVGGNAAADVLSYTGNTRVVTVSASVGEVAWATVGAKVTVALPGGTTVAGEVSGVGAPEQAADGSAAADPANPGAGSANVMLTVAIAEQSVLGHLDASPVDVRYVAKQRADVLTVPVAALLALAEGGYGLEVIDGDRTRVVAVSVGMFAEGRVEVSGAGIDAGTVVGIPT